MGIRDWWSDVKPALQVALRIGNVDPYNKIAALEERNRELRDRIGELEAEIDELEQALEWDEELQFSEGVYFGEGQIGGDAAGPFCSVCWDADDERIRLHDIGGGRFICRRCDTSVHHPLASS